MKKLLISSIIFGLSSSVVVIADDLQVVDGYVYSDSLAPGYGVDPEQYSADYMEDFSVNIEQYESDYMDSAKYTRSVTLSKPKKALISNTSEDRIYDDELASAYGVNANSYYANYMEDFSISTSQYESDYLIPYKAH